MHALFYAPAGGLRAPWRLLTFATATVAAIVLLQGIVEAVASSSGARPGVGATSAVLALALLAAHALALRVVDRRPWSAAGLQRDGARPSVLVRALLLGALAIGLPTALLLAVGWLRLGSAADGSWWRSAGMLLAVLLPAALWEELLVRGYPFAVLRDVWGARGAVLATSAAFALLHVGNPGATPLAIALVAMAGIFLGAVRLATRSLYAAWMAHAGWNWTLAAVFHVSVSGWPFVAPDYRVVDGGPDWATGGAWGPEGGAGAALGMAMALALLNAWPRRGRAADDTQHASRPAGVEEREG